MKSFVSLAAVIAVIFSASTLFAGTGEPKVKSVRFTTLDGKTLQSIKARALEPVVVEIKLGNAFMYNATEARIYLTLKGEYCVEGPGPNGGLTWVCGQKGEVDSMAVEVTSSSWTQIGDGWRAKIESDDKKLEVTIKFVVIPNWDKLAFTKKDASISVELMAFKTLDENNQEKEYFVSETQDAAIATIPVVLPR
ncbi:MAG TPA: hypothetical protein VM432_13345 [Bdellovibrionales bacterium]|nr:hypothetical protein [Bdellovibrionales bacterium]